MATRTYESKERTTEVLKKALWLAWQAAGGAVGLGILRDDPGADAEAVWKNAGRDGDYPLNFSRPNYLSADYVFGRMLKLRVQYADTTIRVPESQPRGDYQAWCHRYPTYASLFDAAEEL